MPDTVSNLLGLTTGQTTLLIIIGAALWFLAALIPRMVAPNGALEGSMRMVTYALVIPGTLPFVWLTKVITQLRRNQIAVGVALVTATALLIDGIVVAWFSALYGDNAPDVKNCAAAILWGAGVGLVLGFIMNKEPKT